MVELGMMVQNKMLMKVLHLDCKGLGVSDQMV